MFLAHYGLHENPFEVNAASRYLYPSPTHREALAALHYGIERNHDFLALVGDHGIGKTIVLRQLALRPSISGRHICWLPFSFKPRERDVEWIKQRLSESAGSRGLSDGRLILFVDEIEDADDSANESLQVLFDLLAANREHLQMVVAALPAVASKLTRPEMQQRVSMMHRLDRLSLLEVQRYINYRLRIAGLVDNPIFTPDAFPLISHRSGGRPRLINSICYRALKLGYEQRVKLIDGELIERAVFGDRPRVSLNLPARTEASPPSVVDSSPARLRARWRLPVARYLLAVGLLVVLAVCAAIIWYRHRSILFKMSYAPVRSHISASFGAMRYSIAGSGLTPLERRRIEANMTPQGRG